MVVGPSLEETRGGAALATTAGRLRTTRGASTTGAGTTGTSSGVADDKGEGAGAVSTVGFARAGETRVGAGAGATASGAASVTVDFVVRDDLALVGSSGATARRSPSLSAFRRIRSAWASSMDADGLDAPIPSVWASASNSLLDKPSSLESSCTRIFFCAKTFPCIVCLRFASTVLYSSTTANVFERCTTSRNAARSPGTSEHRRARETRFRSSPDSHSSSRHHQSPRPAPRPWYQTPFASRPALSRSDSSRRRRQTTQVRSGPMPHPPSRRPRSIRPRCRIRP
jgi:hypothetical protein